MSEIKARGFSARTMNFLMGGALFAVVALIIVPAGYLSARLSTNTAALKFVAEVRRYPTALQSGLESVRDRLSAHGYVQAPLEQVRASVRGIDATIASLTRPVPPNWLTDPAPSTAFAEGTLRARALRMQARWAKHRASFVALLSFNQVPYQDDEATGATLNEAGRLLARDAADAVHAAHAVAPFLDHELAEIARTLQVDNTEAAANLRYVMLAGVGLASLMTVIVLASSASRRKHERLAREARQQTADILRTVSEGLFLLDEQSCIGAAHSAALNKLFRRDDLAGLSFESLLRDLVPERTLLTAMKFVKVLWNERTKENLVRSINPLNEVEVHFRNADGSDEVQYFEFDFHQVRNDSKITHVLVSVTDITARMALARELKDSQEKSQAQLDTLLGILHVDPAQLASFLDDSDASMKMINLVLKEPAREEATFRKKLDTIFRQVHSVKGEAAGLGLASIESRAHSFEEDLRTLREKSGLSGTEFLPLVIKLDDLFTHLQSIRALVAKLSKLRVSADEITEPAQGGIEDSMAPQRLVSSIESTLQNLAQRIASESGKEVWVECAGLSVLPAAYRRITKDVAIQAVRNAVVHGIETVTERQARGKSARGVVRISAQTVGTAGYKLVLEDDGRGLSIDKIKETALEKNFISAEQAAHLDSRQAMALLFRAGFSTANAATKDAGRGVGMNIMADLVNEAGGKLAVSTSSGRFTRFTITLPGVQSEHADHAVA